MEILHSKIIGEGVPFLILHGYLGMGDNWKSLGNQFEEHFQIHLIDQRNHGRSFHADEFDYENLTKDLLNYIQYHNLENVILLGHSMGGKTAMLFAVKYPRVVDRLIIADISPRYYQPHHTDILKALNSVDFSIQNSRKLVDEKITELIPDIGVRSFLLKNVYWKEKGKLAFRMNLKVLEREMKDILGAIPEAEVFTPTLFIRGELSNYILDEDIDQLEDYFPDSTLVTVPNAGHWVHAEAPDLFIDTLLGFCLR